MRYILPLCTFILISSVVYSQSTPDGIPLTFSHAWSYAWTSNAWVLKGRITPVYDANHKIKIGYGQANVGGKWINAARSTFTYNTNGQIIRQLDEDSTSSGWINHELDSLSYNSDGTIKSQIVYRINAGNWAPTFLNNYRYDANKRMTENFEEDRNGYSWQNDDKYEYSYNNDGTLKEILDSNWYGSYFAVDHRDTFNYISGAIHEKVHQDGNGKATNWVNVSKVVFDSTTTTGIEVNIPVALRLTIFPNPSNGQVQISLPLDVYAAQLSVYDISGKLILSRPGSKTNVSVIPLDLGALKAGAYFLVAKTNAGIIRERFIKQ